MKERIGHLALFALSLCLVVGCSSAPPSTATSAPSARTPSTAASVPRAENIVAALRSSQVERNPAQALAYMERALAEEPQRAELLWLTARLCADVPRCDPTTFEAKLRKADSGNGAVWMGPLSRAQEKDDSAAEAQLLEALSREARFDVYWNSLLSQAAVVVSQEARKPAPKMLNGPLTNAINDVSDWLSAVTVPSFAGLANACDQERTRTAQVAERCRKIAQVLQQGDTYAAEAVGIGIAQRAVSPDSPNSIALTERAAVLAYQHDTARDLLAEQVEREKVSAELIELMKQLRREQDVSLAVLRWAGLPLTP